MNLEAVAYTSSAIPGVTDTMLEALLIDARRKNEELGVTGVLLLHDGSFFQYFEGPTPAVEQVYNRIRLSKLHRGIIELLHEPIEQRSFGNWLMGFTRAPSSTVIQLSNASWRAHLRQRTTSESESEGLALLRRFWSVSSGTTLR